MELFFAKLFGIYFIIMGVLVLLRRDAVMPAISKFAEERALILVIASIEILAGVGLILAFPGITFDVAGLISLVGYMLVVEGAIYLAAPRTFVRKMVAFFNRPLWYAIGGALSVFAGLYLAGKGFGYF